MIDSGPEEPRRPVDDMSWVQMEPVAAPPARHVNRPGGWRLHSRWAFPLLALLGGVLIGWVAASGDRPDGDVPSSTPPACTAALAKAEDVMRYDDEGFAIAGRAIHAAGDLDPAAISAETDKLSALSPLKQAASAAYADAARACRDASGPGSTAEEHLP